MKKILFIAAVIAISMTACNGGASKKAADQDAAALTAEAKVYKLDSLMKVADQLIDQTVTVSGFVTHTCVHSGKRCFITSDDQKLSMRVEAKGDIGGFNRELVGSELAITGVVRERRLTKEYIAQYEEQVNEQKVAEDGSAETCAAELQNIADMRKWMEENGKDYYSMYYMDGENYEVIEG